MTRQFKVLHYSLQITPKQNKEVNQFRLQCAIDFIKIHAKYIDALTFSSITVKEINNELVLKLFKVGFQFSSLNHNTNVMIVSKYPLFSLEYYNYKQYSLKDVLQSKKFILKAIIKRGQKNIHIFVTELHSWIDKDNVKRYKQLQELEKYIKKCDISFRDVIIISGNFNMEQIDLEKHLLLKYSFPSVLSTQKYSYDSKSNSMFGFDGTDNNLIKRIQTQLSEKVSLFNEDGKEDDNIQRLYDYAFVLHSPYFYHSCFLEVLVPKIHLYEIPVKKECTKTYFLNVIDISDRYPVLITFMI